MADRYWVGGTGNWSGTTHWSATSGGASGASEPVPADNVYFDANSGTGTVTCNYGLCNDFDATNSSSLVFHFTDILQVYGDIKLSSSAGMTFTQVSDYNCIFLCGTTNQTLDCDGVDILELRGNIGSTRNIYIVSDIKCAKSSFDVGGGAHVAYIVPSEGVTISVQDYYRSDYTLFNHNTLEFTYSATSSSYTSHIFDNRGIDGLHTVDIHLVNEDAGTYSVDMYFEDLLYGDYVFNSIEIDAGITAEQIFTAYTTPFFETGILKLYGKLIAKNCDIGLLDINDGELAVLTVGVLRKVTVREVIGSGGIIGSYGENIYLPTGNILPTVAEVRGNVMTKTSNVYPDEKIKTVTTTADIIRNGKVIKTYNKLAEASYGTKNINSLTREGNIKISMSSDELKASKEYIEKYNEVEIIEKTNIAPRGTVVFKGYILRHTYDYVKKELTLYLASKGYLLQRRLLEDDLEAKWGTGSFGDDYFTTAFAGTELNGVEYAFAPNDYVIGPLIVADATNIKALEYNLLIADGGGDFTLEVYNNETDAIAGVAPIGTTSTITQDTDLFSIGTRFLFSSAIPVTYDGIYYIKLKSTNTYWNITCGDLITPDPTNSYDSSGTLIESIYKYLDYYIYEDVADTKVTINTTSYLALRDVLKKASLRGLKIPTNIIYLQPPSYDFNYTYNTNTIAEAIHKFLETATESTYYYFDDAKDVLVFKEASTKPEVSVPYQKLIKLEMDIDAKDITNEVFFSGGDTGGGVYLYEKFVNTSSKNELKQTLQGRISDQRVTLSDTASRLSNRHLNKNAMVQYNAVIAMSKTDFLDYDIRIGTTLIITGIKGGDYPSLFDVATFDVSCYDFDTTDAGTNVFTVASIDDNSSTTVTMQLGTLAPSLFSDITYANQRLTLAETANNDTAPA